MTPEEHIPAMEDSPRLAQVPAKPTKEEPIAIAAAVRRRMKETGEKTGVGPGDFSFHTEKPHGVTPAYEVKNEMPWHRLALYLKGQGMSNREIAARCGKTPQHISNLTRQPWFREQLEAVIEEEGRESLRGLLEGEGLNSLYTLIDVRDNSASKASDRISASKEILDRLMGKAPQTVEHISRGKNETFKRQDQLEKELAEVEAALKAAGVSKPLGETFQETTETKETQQPNEDLPTTS